MQMVSIAHKNSLRLTHLINDLLDIEKIAAGKLAFDMQWQPLQPLLASAIDENRHYQGERQVNLQLLNAFPEALVRVDSQRLQQVMANLLSNAVKFSPNGGKATVYVEMQSDQVVVSVEDEGAGIPDAFKDRIFNKFSQVDASDSRAKGGTGLGLALSLELIEEMDGSMGFISKEGQGSRFWFALPVNMPANDKSRLESSSDSARILVVEDDIAALAILQPILLQAGYQVDIALTVPSAMSKLAESDYDAITLDTELTEVSGFSLFSALCQQPKTQPTPIVVVSASVEAGELVLDGCLNDIAWLAKPIQTNQLFLLQQHISSYCPPRKLLHIGNDIDQIPAIDTRLHDYVTWDHASDALDARRHLASQQYDVIILDIDLPDGEGWVLLEQINGSQPDTRIIILSNHVLSEVDYKTLGSIFRKSYISVEQLLNTVHQCTTLAKVTDNVWVS